MVYRFTGVVLENDRRVSRHLIIRDQLAFLEPLSPAKRHVLAGSMFRYTRIVRDLSGVLVLTFEGGSVQFQPDAEYGKMSIPW